MAPSPGLLDDPLIPLPVQDSQSRKDSLTGISVKEEQGGGDSPGDGTTTTTGTTAKGGAGAAEEGGVVKANKGMILRKSVEYIRFLFHFI